MLDLLRAIDEALRSIMVHVEVLLPYSEASVLSQVGQLGWTQEGGHIACTDGMLGASHMHPTTRTHTPL